MEKNQENWKLIVEEHGRSGIVRYVEEGNEIRFDWEFSGGNSIVLIWGPKDNEWKKYPWAAGRHQQVFERVAEGTVLQKAPSCKYAIDLQAGTIDIYKS